MDFFKLKLELNFDYTLRFTKKGLNEQSLLINAFTHNDYDTNIYVLNDWKVTMFDNLASAATTELFGFLLNKPSGKIYFNKHKKKFMADGGYIHLFKQEFNGISETTKLMLAKAAEDNKKLEIENLRVEAEKKSKEIELLKQAQQLQEADLRKKEVEIRAQQLEVEKQASEAAVNAKEKKIKIKERWLNYFVLKYKDQIHIRQRTLKDIWQELFEFVLVETEGATSSKKLLELFNEQYGLRHLP